MWYLRNQTTQLFDSDDCIDKDTKFVQSEEDTFLISEDNISKDRHWSTFSFINWQVLSMLKLFITIPMLLFYYFR
jgi:hypothetical protein